MLNERTVRIITICALAVAANMLLILLRHFLWVPLFLDTVFTVAVTFAMGLFPGILVAVLTWLADGLLPFNVQPFHPFVLVAIAEVIVVYLLRPTKTEGQIPTYHRFQTPQMRDKRMVFIIDICLRLIVVYIACVLAVSAVGGVIDVLYHTVGGAERPPYVGLNALRMAFLYNGVPVLLANIFSRIQITMIDRFVVIFGGYLASLAIRLAWKIESRLAT